MVMVRRVLAVVHLLCASSAATLRTTLYVAPHGNDSAAGTTIDAPLASCATAVSRLPTASSAGSAVTIRFAPGMYALNSSTTCGTVRWNGSVDTPLVIAGDPDGTHFDAMELLDATRLAPVTEQRIAKIVNPSAHGNLLVMPMATRPSMLEWGVRPLFESVYPNPEVGAGVAYVRRVLDKGAYFYPGRSPWPEPHCHVCLGDNKSTLAHPCGANISLAEQPTGNWMAEMSAGPGFGALTVRGYLANDWDLETHRVARVEQNSTNTSLQFASYSAYGICEAMEGGTGVLINHCGGPAPGRFTVSGLLSEVDTEGEWWYDTAARKLYIFPPTPPDGSWTPQKLAKVRLGHWFGPGLISIQGSYVTLRDVTVSGVGRGAIASISGGNHNIIGGCTLRNSAGTGVSLSGGHHNTIVGNDLYDIAQNHLTSSGDEHESFQTLAATNNLISNNHITQVYLRGKWDISLRGMGDRFSHNLVHDAPGQLLQPSGPLTQIDHNEVFNTGFKEGDGGVMYVGASITNGYGMHYRENFVHHSMEVPGLHGRGGIYFDDHFGAVSNCSGNVLYKAAGRSFLVNGGAGNNITHNLIINGDVGIYQHGDTGEITCNNGTSNQSSSGWDCLYRAAAGGGRDFLAGAEGATGAHGYVNLSDTPLANRWPSFAGLVAVNSTRAGWASAAHSNFRDNVFLNMSHNICLLTSYNGTPEHPGEACDERLPEPGLPHFIDRSGSIDANFSWFPEAAELEFSNVTLGFDTKGMGLVCDGWRRTLPDPTKYRPWVKTAFNNVPSFSHDQWVTNNVRYTPEAAALRAGLRSGQALTQNFTIPCPAPTKQDCAAAWLAWGECEADGSGRVMRYTIEKIAVAGGAKCLHEDGYSEKHPC